MLLLAREVLAPSLDRRREMRLLEGSENGTCRPFGAIRVCKIAQGAEIAELDAEIARLGGY